MVYNPIMDLLHNPYAPGAGIQPPELAGRDAEIDGFGVAIQRLSQGHPDRSQMLVGLRGVGKTVLLRTLSSEAERLGWATARIESQQGRSLRWPLARAMQRAVRAMSIRYRASEALTHLVSVVKAFSLRLDPSGSLVIGIDVSPATGVADSGDFELDLTELFRAASDAMSRLGETGIAVFIDELQDAPEDDLRALCVAVHEVAQNNGHVIVVGAGLPHLPSVLAGARSYAERLFQYHRIDRLSEVDAERALVLPAQRHGVAFHEAALQRLYELSEGYPYFLQAYGKSTWDAAPESPVVLQDVDAGAEQAEAELNVGFFESRYDRASHRERQYLRAMAWLGTDDAVLTAEVALHMNAKRQSLSPVRDSLIKKGLIYGADRGRVAFTVPHFGSYLRKQPE